MIENQDGIIEMKCPFSARGLDPDEAIKSKKITFWKYDLRTQTIAINKKHPYYYQVQGQLNITQKSFCIFAVWTGKMHNLKTERIEIDRNFFQLEMLPKLLVFYNKWLVPEIIDSRIDRNLPIREQEI